MKKALSLILALVMCLSLCACGGNSTGNGTAGNDNADNTGNSESETTPVLKAEDLAGTWSQSFWFFTTDLVINSNSTYDYGEDKGTFTIAETNDAVKLTPRFGDSFDTNYKYFNGYLYCTSKSFTKDMEYGLPFTPDENGRTNQRFNINLSEGSQFDPAVVANSIDFRLNDDGTFSIFTSVFRYSSSLGYYFNDKPFNTYEGTYKYQNSILTLTYEGVDYPLVVVDGAIYYFTYSK